MNSLYIELIEDILTNGIPTIEDFTGVQSNGYEVDISICILTLGDYEISDNDGYEISLLKCGELLDILYDWSPSMEGNLWIKEKFYSRF